MTREELDIAVDWAKNEGWNPGIHDADCFWAQDPNGFFIGLLDNEPIAVVSGVKYSDDYAFGGFYIVKKEHRGKGYGMKLFNKMMEYVGDRNFGGDGVIENLEKYAKIGLKLAHYNARYNFKAKKSEVSPESIEDGSNIPFEALNEYDKATFGYERKEFLKLWTDSKNSNTYVYGTGDSVKGYGCIRQCFSGYKIGPIFADDIDIARSIFYALVNSVEPDVEVSWDVSEECPLIPELKEEFGMEKVFGTGRIYSKGQPDFPLEKWYGITSFELG